MSTPGRPARLRMQIDGMTCPSCEHHVDSALRAAGAREVEVDFSRGEALFTLEPPASMAELQAAVEQAGYAPGVIEPVAARSVEADQTTDDRMPVAGMTCADCERHVVEALNEAGASRVEANLRHGEARFEAQPRGNGHSSGSEPYDLAIVGSGGGAFAAAIAATERGARVVMIERGTLGGTCVNIGCVPSKTQLRAGELFWRAGHHAFRGIRTHGRAVDLAALVDQKDELVRSLRAEKYADLIDEYGWELVHGEARFEDEQTLRVGGDRSIRAEGFVLATGVRPAVPAIPGLSSVEYFTSTSLLDLKTLPEHLIVIGAGYIGLELGQLFRHLGSQVTLTQRGPRLLGGYDPEIGEAMTNVLDGQGIDILTGATFLGVDQVGNSKRVRLRQGGAERTLEGDALLVATGRVPNTEALNLPAAGVEVGQRGEIVVDDHLRTNNPRVFAAGDMTLGPQYVYVAAYEGALAADNALGGDRRLDLRAVPGVTFTTPSVATVGLTEEAARRAGHVVKSATLPLKAVPRALVNGDTDGLFKVIADASTDEVLGVHVVAENAGDVIYSGVLAVKFHLTVRDLVDTFAPYLTMSEGLKLAAQSFSRDPAKLSCCAA